MRRLVIRPGGIGDLIVSLPALECLRTEGYEVWVPTANAPLIRFADRVRPISSTGLDSLEVSGPTPELLERLRGFDSIVSWYGSNRREFRETVIELGLPVQFFPAIPRVDAAMHATDFYLEQARTLAACGGDGIPRIRCGVSRENFAVIHPFSGSPKKNWPLERFQAVARGLERSMPVFWCRGHEDPPLKGAVEIEDLYELACWVARARLYVGNDSGITHLAAAAGTPVLALFGPTDPAVWGPRGENVRIARWS